MNFLAKVSEYLSPSSHYYLRYGKLKALCLHVEEHTFLHFKQLILINVHVLTQIHSSDWDADWVLSHNSLLLGKQGLVSYKASSTRSVSKILNSGLAFNVRSYKWNKIRSYLMNYYLLLLLSNEHHNIIWKLELQVNRPSGRILPYEQDSSSE